VTSRDRKPPTERKVGWTEIMAGITDSAALGKAFKNMSTVDILINNAGIMRRGTLLQSTEREFDELFAVNVKGSWLVLKEALPHLANDATVVQMCSRHGTHLPKDPALYGLTKNCLLHMSEVFAETYPQYSVKTLCPGPMDTPLARQGLTEEQWRGRQHEISSPASVAALTVELLKDESKKQLLYDETKKQHRLA